MKRRFIFKEIALVSTDGRVCQSWTFKPPCSLNQLDISDYRTVKNICDHQLGLAWYDGTVPYSSLEKIFELIAQEFRVWNVFGEEQFKLVFPYKSMSVRLEKWEYQDDGDNATDGDDDDSETFDVSCIYNHPCCALKSAYRLYKLISN